MDTGTTIIGLIIILAIIVPIMYLSRHSGSKKKQMIQQLTDFARENNCVINKSEIFGSMVFAIDFDAAQLFFIGHVDGEPNKQRIHLKNVKRSKVNLITRQTGTNRNYYKVTDKVEVVFSMKTASEPDIKITIYDSHYDSGQLTGEIQWAEQWAGIVNEFIALPKSSI